MKAYFKFETLWDILAGLVIAGLYFPFVNYKVNFLLGVLIMAALIWLWLRLKKKLFGRQKQKISEAQAIFDSLCDPQTLFEECEDQLVYMKKRHRDYGHVLVTDEAKAFTATGNPSEALSRLADINIDAVSKRDIKRGYNGTKALYYTEYAKAYAQLDEPERAEEYILSARDCAGDEHDPLLRERITNEIDMCRVMLSIREEDYENALNDLVILDRMYKNRPFRQRINCMLEYYYVRIYTATGKEPELTQTMLDDIIKNGGKLYIVKEAQQMKENCENIQ